VFFRATSLAQALHVLAAMVGLGHGSGAYHLRLYVGPDLGLAMAIGVIGSAPIVPWASRWWAERATRLGRRGAAVLETGWSCAELASLAGLLVASAARVAAGTYNPFIYFRF
jgi:alginate O-acetyltransferase complex protein AlgI